MKIKFRTSCAGNRFCFVAGREYDLDDDLAIGFIKAGHAQPVEKRVELSVAPDAERIAVLPAGKKKGRKSA